MNRSEIDILHVYLYTHEIPSIYERPLRTVRREKNIITFNRCKRWDCKHSTKKRCTDLYFRSSIYNSFFIGEKYILANLGWKSKVYTKKKIKASLSLFRSTHVYFSLFIFSYLNKERVCITKYNYELCTPSFNLKIQIRFCNGINFTRFDILGVLTLRYMVEFIPVSLSLWAKVYIGTKINLVRERLRQYA